MSSHGDGNVCLLSVERLSLSTARPSVIFLSVHQRCLSSLSIVRERSGPRPSEESDRERKCAQSMAITGVICVRKVCPSPEKGEIPHFLLTYQPILEMKEGAHMGGSPLSA